MSLYNVAKISTNKLLKNIEIIKETACCDKLCAVVKADAYGHGAALISAHIERFVDYFAVALIEEGVELRLAGIQKPILILIPVDNEDVERAIRYGLTLTVDSVTDAILINNVCRKNGLTAEIHLKADTGMKRLGFDIDKTEKICRIIYRLNNIRVTGCYSHFAEPDNLIRTEKQFKRFLFVRETVKKFFPTAIFHISASGGILNSPRYSLDMVRPGLLLYGYKPFKSDVAPVEPILKIQAKVIKKRFLKRGESVLYGHREMKEDSEVALLRTGYADGLRRRENGTINNKCMDMCAVKYEKNTEYITIFENADNIAEMENTISYEVLCGITRRSRIIYEE